jgi:hypothetical protein
VRTAGEAMKVVSVLCPLIKIEGGITVIMEWAERFARSRLFSIHLKPERSRDGDNVASLNYFSNVRILPRSQCQWPLPDRNIGTLVLRDPKGCASFPYATSVAT